MALTVVSYLSAAPVEVSDYDLAVWPELQQLKLQMMIEASRHHGEPLIRQKRQYWNAIYSPSEYYKKKRLQNRRDFNRGHTTQRYSVWDLSRKWTS